MAFDAFRTNGGPTFYGPVYLPWEADLLFSGLIFCFCILAISFYIIIPGLVGNERIFTFIRITVSLYIGAVILVSNFAQTWETAETQTRTKYKAGTGQEVNVTIGVNIGFRGVNITLKGEKDQIKGETINYNENFNWEGLQGRLGFGPFAGNFNQQYRAAQSRGLPLPILWIAEYFTVDGEGIRFGRFYRQAGWYSHIILWLAFPLWILSNILFFVLLRYGAYFLALTGASMITSNIIWATMRNPNDLKIPFTTDNVLTFSYGGAFWVCLITGIICVVLGIVVFVLDKLWPNHIATFFGVDVLQDSENIIVEEEDVTNTVVRKSRTDANLPEGNGSAATQDEDTDTDELYTTAPAPRVQFTDDAARPYVMRPNLGPKKSYRTSEHRLTKKFQRPRRREAPSIPSQETVDESQENYQNFPERSQGSTGAEKQRDIGNKQSLAEENFMPDPDDTTVEMTRFEPR
uniref:Dual oxidase maturation factor 1 n=1 Tax=Arion vulgaris TaxID=1028688 RepID=A0A0B6ZY84_9EUPU